MGSYPCVLTHQVARERRATYLACGTSSDYWQVVKLHSEQNSDLSFVVNLACIGQPVGAYLLQVQLRQSKGKWIMVPCVCVYGEAVFLSLLLYGLVSTLPTVVNAIANLKVNGTSHSDCYYVAEFNKAIGLQMCLVHLEHFHLVIPNWTFIWYYLLFHAQKSRRYNALPNCSFSSESSHVYLFIGVDG